MGVIGVIIAKRRLLLTGRVGVKTAGRKASKELRKADRKNQVWFVLGFLLV